MNASRRLQFVHTNAPIQMAVSSAIVVRDIVLRLMAAIAKVYVYYVFFQTTSFRKDCNDNDNTLFLY